MKGTGIGGDGSTGGGVWRWLSRNPLPVVLYCLEKGGQSGVSGDVGGGPA
jgi:hypothetical protein